MVATKSTPQSRDPLLDSKQQQPTTGSETDRSSTTTTQIPTKLVVVNLLAYVANVLITYGVGVFGGKTNQELSRKYQTLVTPIGFAFAIWGIIFLAQLVWVLYPLILRIFFSGRTSSTQAAKVWVEAVGFFYAWVVLFQAAWTAAFSQEFIWLSAGAMIILCGFLWRTVSSLKQTASSSSSAQPRPMSTLSYLLWIFPFTLHTGWVSAATAVNINLVLVASNAPSMVQFATALVSLLVLFVVALWITTTRQFGGSSGTIGGDRVIAYAIAWALLGVYFELNTTSDETIQERFSGSQLQVAKFASLIAALVITVFATVKRST